jgi:peptidyl-prolyl cis-trans isomerase D
MLGSFRNRRGGVLVWAMLAALVVGLAGFGIGAGGGITSRNVARVGDQPVSSDDYVRALQQELRALNQQLGRDLPMTEARQFGVDRMVLARLVNDAALDGEAARLGVSAGDAAVRDRVVGTPAFQSPAGSFDRVTYEDALDRIGLRPSQFEELVRHEQTRDLLAAGVQAAATLPDTEALAVLGFLGERRGFEWIRLDAALLPAPVPAPTDAELQAEHQAHAADRYTRPETRHVTYASVTPAALAEEIEIPEDELRAAYDADIEHYRTPERRAVDRIGFPTAEEAQAARTRLDAGETDFDKLAAERGLKPEDIDQGIVAADALPAEARDAVFGATGPGIVGPVETPLGPALYRLNAIIAASTTPFEEVRDRLAGDRALEEAARQISDDTAHIEDLIAGGARIEEIASETVMQLGTIDLNSETGGGIADDPGFRQAAGQAATGVETDLVELAGGGLATLRVDGIDPPEVIPLAEVRDRVAADWTADRTAEALGKLAVGQIGELKAGLSFADLAIRLDRPIATVAPLTRGETAPDLPPELVADVFAAAGEGTAVTRRDGDTVILARLTAIEPFDAGAEANARVLDNLRGQYREQVRDDALALYTAALRETAGVTLNQSLVESTLARFP